MNFINQKIKGNVVLKIENQQTSRNERDKNSSKTLSRTSRVRKQELLKKIQRMLIKIYRYWETDKKLRNKERD